MGGQDLAFSYPSSVLLRLLRIFSHIGIHWYWIIRLKEYHLAFYGTCLISLLIVELQGSSQSISL